MPRVSGAKRTEALRKRREELDRQLREAEAADRKRTKAELQKRAELAGTIALDHAAKHPESEFARQLFELVNAEITKPQERALFGTMLPAAVLPAEAENPAG